MSDYKVPITLNFCWLKRWHIGILLVIMINVLTPFGLQNSWNYSSLFDNNHSDKNKMIQAEWQTSCCMIVGTISSLQWSVFGCELTSIILTDIVTWFFVNKKFKLIEFKLKTCEVKS